MPTTDNSAETLRTIHNIRYDWCMSYGAVTLTVVLSIVMGHLAVGVATLLLAHALRVFGRTSTRLGRDMPFALMSSSALLLTGTIMVVISLLMHWRILDYIFEASSINEDIPYVSALIVYPAVFGFAALARIRMGGRYGASQSTIIAETRYLLRYTMVLSGVMSVVDWAYYFGFYINVNFNSPDKFFYYAVPVVMYVLSLIYLNMRNIAAVCTARASASVATHGGQCRCLIVCEDKLLLNNDASGLYDTPISDASDVKALAASLHVGDESPNLRKLYTADEDASPCSHYVCQVHTQDLPEGLSGQWYTLAEVQQKARKYVLSDELCAEIVRLYTIAMTSKKYDRSGRRIPVDGDYRAAFSLHDLLDLSINYQDERWLYIAEHNQDKRMWRLQQFLRLRKLQRRWMRWQLKRRHKRRQRRMRRLQRLIRLQRRR